MSPPERIFLGHPFGLQVQKTVTATPSKGVVVIFDLKGVFTFFDVGHMLNPPVSNVPP